VSVVLDTLSGADAKDALPAIVPVYAEVYAEPPYCEDVADVADFIRSWERRCVAPGLRVVLARDGGTGDVVGFVFGHELTADTRWWQGALEPLAVDTTERPGRTFAVIEMAVCTPYRRQGVAARMHAALLSGAKTERVTLLVRPEREAAPARTAYEHWGYQKVGRIRPWQGAPVYDALVADRSDLLEFDVDLA
jgi:GNAT superfamily N-acetyltransferase